MLSEIPEDEYSSFLRDISQAVELAAGGQPLHGYQRLLTGLALAQPDGAGEPWRSELAGRYLEALEEYAGRWGVRLE